MFRNLLFKRAKKRFQPAFSYNRNNSMNERKGLRVQMNFFEKMQQHTGVSLNDVQKQAVRYSDGPLLLLASPGSGKTTTLNMKIGYLLLVKKIPAHTILAITFSKASAQDMAQRFDQFFGKLTREKVHFSTIHSFAFQVVREYFAKQRITFQLVEGGNDVPLHKKIILRNIFTEIKDTNPTEDEMDELLTYISYVKNRMLSSKQLSTVKSSISGIADMYKAYEQFKMQNPHHPLLDFDDMLTYCLRILQEDEQIRTKYQHRFEYILTDESQDNSVIQHEIITILAKPQNNLCVVADDDQSIFMWRGSDVQKLLEFEKIYPQAKILTMTQNYRSTPEIVKTANDFIKRNPKRYAKEMFTENPTGKSIEIHNMQRYELQLNYVIQEIEKSSNPQETAILYRNNSSAIRLVDKLNKAGLPFYMKDVDLKFFRHWIVEDIINFMRLSYNDSRVDILEKIHTKMSAYITKKQMIYLKNNNDKTSVFDQLQTVRHADYQEQALKKTKQLINKINVLEPEEAIKIIRKNLGYEKSIRNTAEHLGFNEEGLLGVLNQLEHIAIGLPNLESFAKRLKELEEIMKTSWSNKGRDVVTLSTLHSAKGLEYDNVYMIDLVDGVIPSKDDIKQQDEDNSEPIEEAVRLFYVGMTRARKHLELLTYHLKDDEHVEESQFIKQVRRLVKGKELVKKEVSYRESKHARDIPVNAITKKEDLQLNNHVEHHVFGKGEIRELSGQAIGVEFESVGYKKFMIDICLKQGFLCSIKE